MIYYLKFAVLYK